MSIAYSTRLLGPAPPLTRANNCYPNPSPAPGALLFHRIDTRLPRSRCRPASCGPPPPICQPAAWRADHNINCLNVSAPNVMLTHTAATVAPQVRELRSATAALPADYLVVLVGDMVTEEALPSYMNMLNLNDGASDETGAQRATFCCLVSDLMPRISCVTCALSVSRHAALQTRWRIAADLDPSSPTSPPSCCLRLRFFNSLLCACVLQAPSRPPGLFEL